MQEMKLQSNNKQQLMVNKQGWFYSLNKKLKWMPVKKKIFYGVNLLILIIFGGGLLVNNYLNQPEGKVLADYTPPIIEFVYNEGSNDPVMVTPGIDSVNIQFETTDRTDCTVTITSITNPSLSPISPADANTIRHVFDRIDLNQSPDFDNVPADYHYEIACDSNDPDNPYITQNGDFTTLAPDDPASVSMQLSDLRVIPGSTTATINWYTNIPTNSWVYVDLNSNSNFEKVVTDNQLVTSHSVVVRGLEAVTNYDYYVESSTNVNISGFCSSADQSYGGVYTQTVNSEEYKTYENCESSRIYDFTTTAADTALDANVALRVNRDRICDQWLYCDAAAQIINNKKNPATKEDVCFSIGLCDQMDEGGNCANIVDDNFSDAPLTFKTPTEVTKIKNLSGYSKIGLDWGYRCADSGLICDPSNTDPNSVPENCFSNISQCVAAKIDGYYPYKAMQEIGLPINIPNSSFTENGVWPWEGYRGGSVYLSDEAMKVTTNERNMGVEAKNLFSEIDSAATYVLSFMARTDDPGLQIKAQIGGFDTYNRGEQYVRFDNYSTESGRPINAIVLDDKWQEYIMVLDEVPDDIKDGEPLNIMITQESNTDYERTFYIDNINMKSILEVNTNDYIARSCRMYPDKNATACNFYNTNSKKEMQGWQGYCLEPDPGYFNDKNKVCLQWWPVDVIQGETNIFAQNEIAGYNGTKPLYYCLETPGNAPYYQHIVAGGWTSPKQNSFPLGQEEDCGSKTTDVSDLKIYKNEIIEIRIDGVQIDHNGDGFEADDKECGVMKKWDDKANPAKESRQANGAGVLIFNAYNKNYWQEGFTEPLVDDDNRYNYNKYASLNCWEPSGADISDPGKNVSSAMLEFDEHEMLTTITYKHCDVSGGTGSGRYNNINITYRGERCEVLARVVAPDGSNKAWSARVKPNGWTSGQNNVLGYSYEQDYHPYGASVVQEPTNDPTQWEVPLYVEGPSKGAGMQAPYQARAGTPYAISNVPEELVCDGGPNNGNYCTATGICDNGTSCNDDSPCNDGSVCHTESGDAYCQTDYTSVCQDNNNKCSLYPHDKCRSNADCQSVNIGTWYAPIIVNEGYCKEGSHQCEVPLVGSGPQQCCSLSPHNSCLNDLDCVEVADQTASCVPSSADKDRLIGKAVCISGAEDKLGNQCETSADCGQGMTGTGICSGVNLSVNASNILSGGFVAGQERLSQLFAKSYGVWQLVWDDEQGGLRYKAVEGEETCVIPGTYCALYAEYGWDITADDNNEPQVNSILVNDRDDVDYEIVGQGTAVLKFTSSINSNHLPLVAYTVDWGDGTKSIETGLKIKGRSSNDPHVLVHYYKYDNGCEHGEGYCSFVPKITLEDNWGKTGSKEFNKEIKVYAPGTVLNPAILDVTPDVLTFYNDVLPKTQAFKVSNSSPIGEDLNWQIVSATGELFDNNIVEFSYPYKVGYEGVLLKNSSVDVGLTIDNIGGLDVGNYTGTITIVNMDDANNTKTVNVTLVIE